MEYLGALPTKRKSDKMKKRIIEEESEMFLCIKSAEIYAPEYQGKADVLICNEKVIQIAPRIEVSALPGQVKVLQAEGLRLLPGLIDQHVHITGGGGESGFTSRVPELRFSQVVEAGVTTLVGMLGTDSRTRSIQNLVAKTKTLNEEGITAYCLTGAYALPSPTLTGSVGDDIAFIQEIIGVKVAISDHRSMCPSREELAKLAAEARLAGLVSGKVGEVHMHTGSGRDGLKMILDIVEHTDIPVKHFRPTHVRKTMEADAVKLSRLGGYVDYTSGEQPLEQAQVILEALKAGVEEKHLTISSDSNGSMPKWGKNQELVGITYARMTSLWQQICALVEKGMHLEQTLPFVTSNVAKALEIYPQKGCIAEQSDADMILIDDRMEIRFVIARGKLLMENGMVLKKGFFED